MANLHNLETNKIQPVHDNMVDELIRSGKYQFVDREIEMENLEGEIGTMPAEDAAAAIMDDGSGYKFLTSDVKRSIEVEEKYGDAGNQLRAAAEGAARSATLGLSDVAMTQMGVPYEDLEGRSETIGGITGEVGGYFTPTGWESLLGKGMKTVTIPLRATEKAGEVVGKIAGEAVRKATGKAAKDKAARGILDGAARMGARGMTEGALIEGSHAITEQIAKDEKLNAELIVARAKEGGKIGLGIGSLLGAGATAAAKIAKKADEKVIKGLSKAAGDDSVAVDLTLSKNIKGTDKKLADIPHLKLKADGPSYTFMKGDNRIKIDKDLTGKNVLDLDDPRHVVDFGSEIGFYDLPEYKELFSPELGPSVSVLKAYREASKTLTPEVARLQKQIENVKSGFQRANKQLMEVRKKIQQEGRTVKLAAKQKSLSKKVGDLRKSYAEKKAAIDKFTAKMEVDKKIISNQFKKYDAVKMGDDLYVINPSKFDDIKTASFVMRPMKERVENAAEYALRAIGAKTAEFRKLRKSGRVNDVGDFVLDSYMEASGNNKLKGLMTSTDDVMEILERRQLESIAKMDESVTELTNELQRQGLDTGIKGSEISEYIRTELAPDIVNQKTGNVMPGYKNLWNQLMDVADEYNQFSRSVTGKEIPMTPTQFRDLRISLDNITKFESDNFGMNHFRKKIRREMEDILIGRMEMIDGAEDLVNHYKSGKKQFWMSEEALEIMGKNLDRQGSNNKIGLTSYIYGGSGMAAGAAMGGAPGAIALGLLGTAGREFSRKRGDIFMALYADDLFKAHNGAKRRIGKAVNGFLKAPSTGVALAVIDMDSEDLQGNYRKDFVNYKYNPEEMLDKFHSENEMLSQVLPSHVSEVGNVMMKADGFLREKLPKNPYGSDYFKSYTPSELELRKFERYKQAVANPLKVIDEIQSGSVSNEAIESLRVVYPGIFEEIKQQFFNQMDKIKPDYRKRIQLDKMFGLKGDFYLQKQNIDYLQQSAKGVQQREEEKRLAGGKLNVDNRAMTEAQSIGQA